jgi:hypothetical protein
MDVLVCKRASYSHSSGGRSGRDVLVVTSTYDRGRDCSDLSNGFSVVEHMVKLCIVGCSCKYLNISHLAHLWSSNLHVTSRDYLRDTSYPTHDSICGWGTSSAQGSTFLSEVSTTARRGH